MPKIVDASYIATDAGATGGTSLSAPSAIVEVESVNSSYGSEISAIRVRHQDGTWNRWSRDWYVDDGWSLSTTAALHDASWGAWNSSMRTTASTMAYVRSSRPAALTPEQMAAEAARRDQARVAVLAIETAKDRAEKLLLEHLNDRQKRDLADKRYFDVTVADFKKGVRRYYRIHRGRAGNVTQLDGPNGNAIRKFCCHPVENVPDADTMLSQKLMLEACEELFLKTANITELTGSREVRVGQGLQAGQHFARPDGRIVDARGHLVAAG